MPYLGQPGNVPFDIVEPTTLLQTIGALMAAPAVVGAVYIFKDDPEEAARAERHMAQIVSEPGHFDQRCDECCHFLGITEDRFSIRHIFNFASRRRREAVRRAMASAYRTEGTIEFLHYKVAKDEITHDRLEVLTEPGQDEQVVIAYQAV